MLESETAETGICLKDRVELRQLQVPPVGGVRGPSLAVVVLMDSPAGAARS